MVAKVRPLHHNMSGRWIGAYIPFYRNAQPEFSRIDIPRIGDWLETHPSDTS